MMKKKIIIYSIGTLLLAGMLAGGYVFLDNILKDRLSAINFKTKKQRPPNKQVRRYTQKEIEEAMKKGELPDDMKAVANNQSTNNNLDAVQRSLKTVQDIQRINEQNRRLMEQQRLNNR